MNQQQQDKEDISRYREILNEAWAKVLSEGWFTDVDPARLRILRAMFSHGFNQGFVAACNMEDEE